jgi:hypothetical protein
VSTVEAHGASAIFGLFVLSAFALRTCLQHSNGCQSQEDSFHMHVSVFGFTAAYYPDYDIDPIDRI